MSSRQEEKERRRQERIAREQAAAAAAQRRRLFQMVGGVIVSIAVVGGIIFAVAGGGGGVGKAGDPITPTGPTAKIPPRRDSNLTSAVAAAGCAFRQFPSEGREHVTKTLTIKDFKTNPPTSGNHNPVPAADGIYAPNNPPELENWVHTLEHGRIELQYAPGTSAHRRSQLETLFNEPVKGGPDGYHMMLFENNTGMPYQVAAVAWTRYVVCRHFNDKVFDALRDFRDEFVDTAPEQIP